MGVCHSRSCDRYAVYVMRLLVDLHYRSASASLTVLVWPMFDCASLARNVTCSDFHCFTNSPEFLPCKPQSGNNTTQLKTKVVTYNSIYFWINHCLLIKESRQTFHEYITSSREQIHGRTLLYTIFCNKTPQSLRLFQSLADKAEDK